MGTFLMMLLSAVVSYFSFEPLEAKRDFQLPPIMSQSSQSFDTVEHLLKASGLKPQVQDKVLRTLQCTREHNVVHNQILSVIDYSLPSNVKRFWVFDLNEKKLLFYTYVSHGIKSGTLFTNYFSNKFNSKASSLGVYKTDKAYYGREGLSLRLDGLEWSFNDNAANRSIVMHGGWYVDEGFIKRYGRPGRSWGCPAVPKTLFQPIINTIKDSSLFVAYYPTEQWLLKSRFLNCESMPLKSNMVSVQTEAQPALGENEQREEVLFASTNRELIVTISADNYVKIFKQTPPLGRMLRRRVGNLEYIALSTAEFNRLAQHHESLEDIHFVSPELKMIRGYYETQMKLVPLGKIKELKASDSRHYSVYFESHSPLGLRASNQFIRWLGL